MKKRLISLCLNLCVLGAVAVLAFPVVWIVMNSFKVAADVNTWPPVFFFDPTIENFQVLFDLADADATNYGTLKIEFLNPVINSTVIAVGAVLLSLIAGVPAGYALARYDFRGKDDLAFFILGFRFAPVLLVVIPLFWFFQSVGLYDSYLGMIWVYQLVTLPMIIWLSRSYVEDIPLEIEEAAAICGASRPRIMLLIVLPLAQARVGRSIAARFFAGLAQFRTRPHPYGTEIAGDRGTAEAPQSRCQLLSGRVCRARHLDDRPDCPHPARSAPP